jgi:hypothetical protein
MLQAGGYKRKDDSTLLFRHLAHRVEADSVFVIVDAWALPPDRVRRIDQIIERYASISASRYRIDVASNRISTVAERRGRPARG